MVETPIHKTLNNTLSTIRQSDAVRQLIKKKQCVKC